MKMHQFTFVKKRPPLTPTALRTRSPKRPVDVKRGKIACEQALLFGRAARSRETRFARPNRRACSQARGKKGIC